MSSQFWFLHISFYLIVLTLLTNLCVRRTVYDNRQDIKRKRDVKAKITKKATPGVAEISKSSSNTDQVVKTIKAESINKPSEGEDFSHQTVLNQPEEVVEAKHEKTLRIEMNEDATLTKSNHSAMTTEVKTHLPGRSKEDANQPEAAKKKEKKTGKTKDISEDKSADRMKASCMKRLSIKNKSKENADDKTEEHHPDRTQIVTEENVPSPAPPK